MMVKPTSHKSFYVILTCYEYKFWQSVTLKLHLTILFLNYSFSKFNQPLSGDPLFSVCSYGSLQKMNPPTNPQNTHINLEIR